MDYTNSYVRTKELVGTGLTNFEIAANYDRQTVDHTAVLLKVSQAVTSTIDLPELLELVVEQVASVVGADRASIWLLDSRGGMLTSAAITGVDAEFAQRWRGESRHWEQEPLSRLALEQGELVVSEDAQSDSRTDKGAVELFGDRSILVAPLLARGNRIGTLYLNHVRQRHSYSPEELDLIRAIAGQVAQAIWNAELYDESQRRRERLRTSFQRVGSVLSSGTSLDDTLKIIVDAAVDFLGASGGGLAMPNPISGAAVIRAERGEQFSIIRGETERLLGVDSADEVTAVVPDPDGAGHSFLAVKLRGRGAVVGVLGVVMPNDLGFDAEAKDLLRTYGSQAAVAIEDAKLYQAVLSREREAQRRIDELNRLNQIGSAINESLELERVFEVIAESAKALVDSDVASILLIEENMGQRLAVTVPGGFRTPIRRDGLTNLIYRSGDVVLVPDVSKDSRVNPEVIQQGVQSLIGVPLRVDGKTEGVLYLNSYRTRDYEEGSVRLLRLLAGQAVFALKNAQLYEEVVKEKEKLSAIVENSSDGIMLINGKRRLLTVNPALDRMLGAGVRTTEKLRCYELLGCGGTIENICQACPMSTEETNTAGVELRVQTKTGRPVDLAVTKGRLAQTEGEETLGVAMFRDVSASRRLEEAKANFVLLISHELRTPLSLVKGYLSTLRRADQLRLEPERRLDYLKKADEAADRLHRLTDDLLTASRLDTGTLNLQLRETDLKELVKQEASWCETLGIGRTIELTLPESPAFVQGDKLRLEQVIHNLVDNAHKYSPVGRPIAIRLEQVTRMDRPFWQIVVKDQGEGLSPEDAARIFEKFYRGEYARGHTARGIGLGLSIVKGLVEAHQGEVWVETGVGAGSSFFVVLPAADPSKE